jgi:hypothetical protein
MIVPGGLVLVVSSTALVEITKGCLDYQGNNPWKSTILGFLFLVPTSLLSRVVNVCDEALQKNLSFDDVHNSFLKM